MFNRQMISHRLGKKLALVAILVSVAVAFADSSIVVLALPDLLKQYDASITETAWVVTAYNLALAVFSLVLVRASTRANSLRLVRVGLALFLLASLGCGAAWGLWPLVVFRSLQGLGGALLLVGSLSTVRQLDSERARGPALWIGAGVFGTALGPAAGGLLTDVLGWRAIFFAQAPVAALTILGTLGLASKTRADSSEATPAANLKRRASAANIALAFISAALVGLLFLSVVLLIDVWRLSPLTAAIVVSVIPLTTLMAQILVARAWSISVASGGALFLAAGLAGMALAPSRGIAWIIVSLAVSGFGLGLVIPGLGQVALADGNSSSGALMIGARHVGLVAGLLILTPLLAGDFTTGGERAKLQATSVVLDMPTSARTKLQLAFDLAPVLSRPASDGLPDFTKELESRNSGTAATLGHRLDSIVRAAITLSFRRSFLSASLLALLSMFPLLVMSPIRARWSSLRRVMLVPAAALVTFGVLTSAEVARGTLSLASKPRVFAPCAPRDGSPGGGSLSFGQRVALTSLDALACRFHK